MPQHHELGDACVRLLSSTAPSKKLTLPVYRDYTAAPDTYPFPAPPDIILYTHWAPCPTNGEPILAIDS